MIIIMQDAPIVSLELSYKGNKKYLDNVLLDTRCSNTIFDTDEVEQIGLIIDRESGRPRRMYGVGEE